MDPRDLFARTIKQASGMVSLVEPRHFSDPTPCTEWSVHDLLNHMLYELVWVPDLVEGKTVAEVGKKHDGDLLTGNFQKRWQDAANKAVDVVKQADTSKPVHLSYGDTAAGHYIAEVGGDLLVHAWDLGQGLRCTLLMEPDVAEAVYQNTLPKVESMASGSLFAPPVTVPEDADIQTKLLALMGRKAAKV